MPFGKPPSSRDENPYQALPQITDAGPPRQEERHDPWAGASDISDVSETSASQEKQLRYHEGEDVTHDGDEGGEIAKDLSSMAIANASDNEGFQTVKRRRNSRAGSPRDDAGIPKDGIPTVPTAASAITVANVEAYLKRKVSDIEAAQRSQKKAKPIEVEPTHITLGERMEIDDNPPFADQLGEEYRQFREVDNPRNRYCRAMVFSTPEEAAAFHRIGSVGSIFTPHPRLSVMLKIEAGRYGMPEIALIFRLKVPKQSGKGTLETEVAKTFEVSWRPGVKRGGEFMLDNFECVRIMDGRAGDYPHFPSLYNDCPENKKEDIERLIALEFRCGWAKTKNVEPNDWKHLDASTQRILKRICLPEEPYRMCVWTIALPDVEFSTQKWIKFLKRAVNQHLPPMWQYQNKEGRMECSFKHTPQIWEVGDGMYNVYPKNNGKEDRSKEPTSFYTFPFQPVHDMPIEAGVTYAIPVVRNVQYEKAQANALQLVPHRFVTMMVPILPNSKAVKQLEVFKHVCHVFVRLMPTPGGNIPAPPAVDTWVEMELDNSVPSQGKPHTSGDKNRTYFGNVINHEKGCDATGTHFCILVNQNKGRYPSTAYTKLQRPENRQMPQAYFSIRVDTTAAKRELVAATSFSNPAYETEALFPIRQAFIGDPDKMPKITTDLMDVEKGDFNWWLKQVEESAKDNPNQVEVVRGLQHIEDKLLAIVGPPGAGKTKALADAIIACLSQHHKCLIVGPANKSVDQAANYVFRKFPKKFAGSVNFLRFEVSSAELRAMVTVKDFATLGEQDPLALPTLQDPVTDDVSNALNEALARTVREHDDNDTLLLKCWRTHNDLKKALADFTKRQERKATKVPIVMTSGYHLYKLCMQDELQAAESFNEVIELWKADKCSDEELAVLVSDGYDPGTEHWEAASSRAHTQDEIDGLIAAGKIKSQNDRNKSFAYNTALKNFIQKRGAVYGDDRKQFIIEWTMQMHRVFSKVDCVFTTCNNAGSALIRMGFEPKILACDEAGQVTMSSLAIILTAFKGWLALLLFGDPNQLRPYSIAGTLNEFRENSRVSSLGLLDAKNCHILRLTIQYRMAKAIAQWTAKYFYNDQLSNHFTAEQDNDWRRTARAVSKKFYGIHGPNGDGSEFFVIDVVHGISRVQKNSTSLVNHANSDASIQLVDRLLDESASMGTTDKARPEDINILTYYTGQKFITVSKLREAHGQKGRTWEVEKVEASSVDAFQGQESRYVVVDVVVGHLKYEKHDPIVQEEGSDDEDEDRPWLEKTNSAKVSSHVRDANRLCCAITRARDGLFFIMQASVVMGTAKGKQSKARAALSEFFKDALNRKLVHVDDKHMDTSPEGEKLRADWSVARLRQEQEKQKAERMAAMTRGLRQSANFRVQDPVAETRPVFSTPSGPASSTADRTVKDTTDPAQSLQAIRDNPDATMTIDIGSRGQKDKKQKARESKAVEPAGGHLGQGLSRLLQLNPEETEEARASLEKAQLQNEATREVRKDFKKPTEPGRMEE